jgi:HK97 family phage major capsid protein
MKEVIEKLDAIESANIAKVEEIKVEVAKSLEEVKAQVTEQVAALEAKVAAIQPPAIIKIAKTVHEDVNRSVKEQLRDFYKSGRTIEKEIKMFADEGQYDAYLKEASTLTGSGAGIGGRTAYDPMFVPLRLANPMRGVSRNVSTEGATYQFRAKIGNTGPAWGYAIQNNGNATTVGTNIWQLTLQDLNVQFPIRTASLDDIDGLESNVVSDMLVEFSQSEALSMIKNDDQDAGAAYGGTNGLRGLNQYDGAAATYAGGQITVADFGTTGTGSSSGLHDIATYDQLTTNAAGSANNVVYKDLINFIYDLPQEYWTPSCCFVINPLMLAGIRGLVDDNGTPVFERMNPMENNGIVGRLLGFDVVVNKYLDNPTSPGTAATVSLYPMYFGDWSRGHTIVDRLNMILRRYDQTLPGFITFYGEKRLCTSVVDPFSIIRYRSTATGA